MTDKEPSDWTIVAVGLMLLLGVAVLEGMTGDGTPTNIDPFTGVCMEASAQMSC